MATAAEQISVALGALTVAFGLISLISPRYALAALHLSAMGRADGLSELRASSGGAYIATGLAALIAGGGLPILWLALGVQYAGAAVGRLASILLDRAGSPKVLAFFAIEALFAGFLIAAHWPGAG